MFLLLYSNIAWTDRPCCCTLWKTIAYTQYARRLCYVFFTFLVPTILSFDMIDSKWRHVEWRFWSQKSRLTPTDSNNWVVGLRKAFFNYKRVHGVILKDQPLHLNVESQALLICNRFVPSRIIEQATKHFLLGKISTPSLLHKMIQMIQNDVVIFINTDSLKKCSMRSSTLMLFLTRTSK